MIVMAKAIYIKLQGILKVTDKSLRPLRPPTRPVTAGVIDHNPPLQSHTPLYICSYNARSLSSDEKLLEFKESISKTKHDIIGLAEIRRMGYNILEDQDHIFYFYGETKGQYRVIDDKESIREQCEQLGNHFISIQEWETAERVLISCNMVERCVRAYTNAGKIADGLRLALTHLSEEQTKDIFLPLALQLRQEGQLRKAEQIYIGLGDPDAAISMYKEASQYEAMLRLVAAHRGALLEATRRHVAQALHAAGDLRAAETYYVQAGDWKNAVAMYRSAGQWESAERVARAHSAAAAQQVALQWAGALAAAPAARLLAARGLAAVGAQWALQAQRWDIAMELSALGGGVSKREVARHEAAALAEARPDDAEAAFLRAGAPADAVRMWLAQGQCRRALALAEQHAQHMVDDVLVAGARDAAERGDLVQFEALMIRANRPKEVVQHYKDLDDCVDSRLCLYEYIHWCVCAELWEEARRVAREYLPDGAEPVPPAVPPLLQRAADHADRGEWWEAVELLLAASAAGAAGGAARLAERAALRAARLARDRLRGAQRARAADALADADHDIDSIHRVRPYPSSRTESNNEPTRPASIIVRFCQRRRKDQLIAAVRARRGLTTAHIGLPGPASTVYIGDHLTPTNKLLLKRARELKLEKNYSYLQDRKSTDGQGARGGGVLIAARRELRARPRPEWRSGPAAEELWVTLELDTATTTAVGAARPSRPAPRPCRAAASSNLHVACCYFPHGNNHSESLQNFYDNTFDILPNNLNDNFLILGDFNISNASWDSFNDSTQSFKLSTNSDGLAGDLCDFMNLSNFRQYNGCVNSNGRVLDLVLSSDKCTVSNTTTPLTPEDAHHKSLDITLNLQTHAFIQNVKTRLKLIYHAADFKAIGTEISRVNWIADLATLNTEESVSYFYNILQNLIDVFAEIGQSDVGEQLRAALVDGEEEENAAEHLKLEAGSSADYGEEEEEEVKPQIEESESESSLEKLARAGHWPRCLARAGARAAHYALRYVAHLFKTHSRTEGMDIESEDVPEVLSHALDTLRQYLTKDSPVTSADTALAKAVCNEILVRISLAPKAFSAMEDAGSVMIAADADDRALQALTLLMGLHVPQIASKVARALPRYTDIIVADVAFFICGEVIRAEGSAGAREAFVFLNHCLDLAEAADEDTVHLIDYTDFECTDWPRAPLTLGAAAAGGAALGAARDWVLAVSMDQQVDQTLPTDSRGLYASYVGEEPCCVLTGHPLAARLVTFPNGRCANREWWSRVSHAARAPSPAAALLRHAARWCGPADHAHV
ncbi:unnamed protein product, partial [Brenthis ino]